MKLSRKINIFWMIAFAIAYLVAFSFIMAVH